MRYYVSDLSIYTVISEIMKYIIDEHIPLLDILLVRVYEMIFFLHREYED